MICNDGTSWEPAADQVEKWKNLYPAVNVEQELRAMEGWLDANPKKCKTVKGMPRFCNSWLSRAQDRGGSSGIIGNNHNVEPGNNKAANYSGTKTRDMSDLDGLTHDFADSPEFRVMCLDKYGQYFANGQRHTA